MNTVANRWGNVLLFLILVVVAVVFLSPFYFVLANSVKSYGEIVKDAGAFPAQFAWKNYTTAWRWVDFPRAFLNSLFVTSISLLLMMVVGSMAAWRMVRRPHPASTMIFGLFVVAMVIPFQSVMIPLMKVASELGLINSRLGIIIIYQGFGMPLTVFLLHGFVKTVPRELEESAYLDGCRTWQTYYHIVLPLLKSILATVAILQTFWIWNDFLLPLLVIFDPVKRTIPLAIFSFFGQYSDRWDYALATLNMGMLPIIVFFLVLQRFIIQGVAAGSLKG